MHSKDKTEEILREKNGSWPKDSVPLPLTQGKLVKALFFTNFPFPVLAIFRLQSLYLN